MRKFLPILSFPLIILTAIVILGQDIKPVLIWWLIIAAIGIVFLPLTNRVFNSFTDKGYLFAKPLGIALSSYIVWLLSSFKILAFSTYSVILVLIVMFMIQYIPNKGFRKVMDQFKNEQERNAILYQEALLLAGIVAWAFIRGFNPDLKGEGGLEKFMDYGYVNTILRTRFMPPIDMWFSGNQINYYYYGHYITAFLTKLSGFTSAVTYNLMMSTLFSFGFSLTFSLVFNTIALIRTATVKQAISAGLIAAALLSLGGNLHTITYTSIFQPNRAAINKIIPDLEIKDSYWFPDATRFIGHNPNTIPPNEDKTIHEFPIYSFVVSDLHAHVINIPFVLTLLALLVSMIKKTRNYKKPGLSKPEKNRILYIAKSFYQKIFLSETLLIAFLLGIFQMTNFWDFPIYSIVSCAVFLYTSLLMNKDSVEMIKPTSTYGKVIILLAVLVAGGAVILRYPLYLVITGFLISYILLYLLSICRNSIIPTLLFGGFVLALSSLVALPFSSKLSSMTNGIGMTTTHSLAWQLLVIWGYQLFFGISFIITEFFSKNSDMLYLSGTIQKTGSTASKKITKNTQQKTIVINRLSVIRNVLTNMHEDVFISILFLCGIGLLIIPEIVYIKDIYDGGYYRSNTMFKLTYQAFILFAITSGYFTYRLYSFKEATIKILFLKFTTIVLVLSALIYPLYAINEWYGKLNLDRRTSLDGAVFLKNNYPDDYAAAQWLKFNETGQPVVLEANGLSYTDNGRISVETGMPTILGWYTHEWLWRNNVDLIEDRVKDIRIIYESNDIEQTKSLLKQYDVKYIVIGKLEHETFPELNEDKLMKLGTLSFEQETIKLILIN